jgi:hypothetical protein
LGKTKKDRIIMEKLEKVIERIKEKSKGRALN